MRECGNRCIERMGAVSESDPGEPVTASTPVSTDGPEEYGPFYHVS
jgi:hypothetical protein